MNEMVSSLTSIPPPRDKGRVSNNTSLNLPPITGFNSHPLPFPPLNVIETTLSISKS